ncbi:hypothetical protein E6P09_04910 [Haloferax mediterranei ATCC 33500]|uniref:Uncharacterized protein n=1 Tax=Haloferax mediterranei (strain ATCC 33500 / DSM 1411 / JCM 8866 / NBRC 14739 / NCIMB 2177 / R-4) TaxID=523841 RepID=I3R1J3_HALMT|nr:hypothetical protein [Haloferax mediterranei]AFK18103.1 hypothetical protein HFX_0367 [Haloferax mediterranei ATCC 33500]AHZ22489.1 hypothetical protein BM92_07425 [Haloferax mediterranei ATCC 33500]EMA02624.1 hypothetical protein C439_08575 [Haloferax mediterranei ATCC 33500]MDX5988193.1 hypothetical protein [Haloferax mediterranei ATCC 33500]QCQ74637.1 hypothetical protein E6P09_04910 [Haloferax mediterranei ATCC 33500]
MGLTCRLLGHSYGDSETEREREERGDEVVVSIRELQVCTRCGQEQVISENKEVTAIRTPEELGMTEGEAETAAAGFEPANPMPGTDEADSPDIETAPDPETETGAGAGTEAEAEVQSTGDHPTADETPDAEEADAVDAPPVTDDAIILGEDEEESVQRDRTQWPDEVDEVETDDPMPETPVEGDDAEFIDADAEVDETDAAPEQTRKRGAWPDPPGEDEGWDAEPDDGEPVSVSFGGGLAPEGNGSTAPESNGQYIDAESEDDFVRADETNVASEAPDEAIEYYCPNCGHARGASASSMRAGDICPECKKGYIAERES